MGLGARAVNENRSVATTAELCRGDMNADIPNLETSPTEILTRSTGQESAGKREVNSAYQRMFGFRFEVEHAPAGLEIGESGEGSAGDAGRGPRARCLTTREVLPHRRKTGFETWFAARCQTVTRDGNREMTFGAGLQRAAAGQS